MKKPFLTLIALLMASLSFAQSEKANEVMNTLRLANNYFMSTIPTVGLVSTSGNPVMA